MCKNLSEHDAEFLENYASNLIDDMVSKLLINQPEDPLEFIACSILSPENSVAIGELINELASVSHHSSSFALKCKVVYDEVYRITSAQNSQCVGEVISAIVRGLIRNTFASEGFLSHLKLERCVYMSFMNFKKLLETTLNFRDFTTLCSKLFQNSRASPIRLLRLVEDITKNSEVGLSESAEFLSSLQGEEQSSIKYEDFMKNATELFISQLL
ncbi:hypothetical protein P879_03460 [Paragonimus westermani]|uniref:Uncharacterized protein n=1 Tax=Paragonimus westermani TaxID=34504 RepID=A0A8T0DLB8_9TREM|nr:hypothetical protein P879_03460 [Paragonimus westermani]